MGNVALQVERICMDAWGVFLLDIEASAPPERVQVRGLGHSKQVRCSKEGKCAAWVTQSKCAARKRASARLGLLQAGALLSRVQVRSLGHTKQVRCSKGCKCAALLFPKHRHVHELLCIED